MNHIIFYDLDHHLNIRLCGQNTDWRAGSEQLAIHQVLRYMKDIVSDTGEEICPACATKLMIYADDCSNSDNQFSQVIAGFLHEDGTWIKSS
jgi:hypothetical protein